MPFQKGNTLATGRPKKSKNRLPKIRDRILHVLNKRLLDPRELAKLETRDLIRFASSILPKDMNIKVAPDITYVSQTPRPESLIGTIPNETKLLSDDTVPNEVTPVSIGTTPDNETCETEKNDLSVTQTEKHLDEKHA